MPEELAYTSTVGIHRDMSALGGGGCGGGSGGGDGGLGVVGLGGGEGGGGDGGGKGRGREGGDDGGSGGPVYLTNVMPPSVAALTPTQVEIMSTPTCTAATLR